MKDKGRQQSTTSTINQRKPICLFCTVSEEIKIGNVRKAFTRVPNMWMCAQKCQLMRYMFKYNWTEAVIFVCLHIIHFSSNESSEFQYTVCICINLRFPSYTFLDSWGSNTEWLEMQKQIKIFTTEWAVLMSGRNSWTILIYIDICRSH